MVDPNSILVFDLDSRARLRTHAMHEFDLRQFKQAPVRALGFGVYWGSPWVS